jgi:NAD(P)-dependent dehydrogenase (short-subunit alcohol dehydrogenase family)
MKTWLITGANRGIGLALTEALTARGDAVIGVCRSASPALTATGARVIDGVDVTDEGSYASVSKALHDTRIDVLVNNAGVLESDRLDSTSHASMARQMEINAFAPLLFSRAMLPHLASGAKLIVITSRMGSIGDNGSGGYYGYRMSKAAVNAAFVSLARDLAPIGVSVGILHPGMVATDMTHGHGIPVGVSAAGLIARIDAVTMERSGRFYHQNGEELPW